MTAKGFELRLGDCLDVLKGIGPESADLFYIDPPFYTQKVHSLATRNGDTTYSFKDLWTSRGEYSAFLNARLEECRRCLKPAGAIFFHCNEDSSHIARSVLDDVFGTENFRSEIIWTFRRWSNSKKGLLQSRQTILYYSKSDAFKFNSLTVPYSESTNLDQILQKRIRDDRGKAIYVKDENGEPLTSGGKRGVPLGDVWSIPYLNPKARERVGYPTQKPILLMERIIEICTDFGDLVVDPFCGSGTTLVAAQYLGRRAIGIDDSKAALELAERRLSNPVRTESRLLKQGRDSYARPDLELLECLDGLSYHPVHRNRGMDAVLAEHWHGKPVCIRIQRRHETISYAAKALSAAAAGKGGAKLLLVVVEPNWGLLGQDDIPSDVTIIRSTAVEIQRVLQEAKDWTAAAHNSLATAEAQQLPDLQAVPRRR